MPKKPLTLKLKFFLWIIGICMIFGLFAAFWVYLDQKNDRLDLGEKDLAIVSSRYAMELERDFKKMTELGRQANAVVQNLFTNPPPPRPGAPITKDENGALRSNDGFSGGFFSNLHPRTRETDELFAKSQHLWTRIAPIVKGVFFNFYMITNDGFIRIHPRDWAQEVPADHDFHQDIFFSVATPANNPRRTPIWTPVYYDSIWKKWMTSLIIPLYRGDQFLGITGSDFILDELFSRITTMAQTEGGRQGFVLDQDGQLLVHPEYMTLIQELRQDLDMNTRLDTKNIPNASLRRFIDRMQAGWGTTNKLHTYMDGMRTIMAYPRGIPTLNWTFVTYTDKETTMAGLNTLRKQILLASLSLAILLALILGLGFNRIILHRLSQLTKATLEIGQGYLDCTIPTGSLDEVGVLAREFAKMRDSVKASIRNLATENQERRQAEENLRITLDSIGDGVIATDTEGVITRMNRVAEAMTDWTIEEARGQSLPTVFIIKDADTGEIRPNPVTQILQTDQIINLPSNTTLTSRGETLYHIADSGAPIRNEAGQVHGVVLVFRDVTDQLALEEQLRQSQKMDSIGKLAGGVAHDFNNLLCGIQGYAELVEESASDEECRRYAGLITETAEQAAALTAKLLDFSRKGKTISTNLDLHTIINGALSLLAHSLDKRISLEKDFNAHNTVVNGDPSQLQNAFINLCVNSSDAIDKVGKITVATRNVQLDSDYCHANHFKITPGPFIEVAVIDTGEGMDQGTIKKIFEPFFTTKDVGKGTGFGLAAVYGSIKDHNGAITVYSEPGQGSEFHLLLPLASTTAITPEAEQLEIIHGAGRILVADDEEVVRKMTRDMLTKLGYTVLLAKDGREALDYYKKEQDRIDAVILDLVMPEMGGQDCFREIRALNPTAKILIASGFTRNVMIEELLAAGLKGFISKPFSLVEFSHTLNRILKD